MWTSSTSGHGTSNTVLTGGSVGTTTPLIVTSRTPSKARSAADTWYEHEPPGVAGTRMLSGAVQVIVTSVSTGVSGPLLWSVEFSVNGMLVLTGMSFTTVSPFMSDRGIPEGAKNVSLTSAPSGQGTPTAMTP